MTCDPNWSDVVLYLEMDGTNGSTTFLDTSPVGNTVTASNTTVDTGVQVGGLNSALAAYNASVPPTEGLSAPIAAASPLDILSGSADFTIEGWFYIPAGFAGDAVIFDYGDGLTSNSTSGISLYVSPLFSLIQIACSPTVPGWGAITGPYTLAVDTWYHFAVQRTAGIGSLYFDGVNVGGTPQTWAGYAGPPVNSVANFGGGAISSNNGYPNGLNVAQVKVTAGLARYSTNFTPTPPLTSGACSTTVPNIIGDTLSVATAAILAESLVVGTVGDVANPATAGTVVDQSPVGGSTVTPGTAVDFDLSLGPTVPNILGESLSVATAAILAEGLVVGTVGYIPNAALAGTVVDQTPLSGTSVSPGDAVSFDLSLGSVSGGVTPNILYDEAIYGAYFGGQLNLVEFTYMPGRTPFEEGATNLIINRYKQEPTDNRQRGVDFTQFVVPGETLQTVAVTGISAQGVPQASTSPLVTPLVLSNVIIDPVTNLKFGYSVSGGQNGVEYTVQFTCTTSIQTQTLEEIFSINIMIEDMFP